MTILIVCTVVGYFIFIPKTAPKLITLAVTPFDAPESVPEYLSQELPRHLTELLAESRDLYVVDFEASAEALSLSEFRGFLDELGATHIVDGNFEYHEETNDLILNTRVIDISQAVWKMKWDEQYEISSTPLIETRDRIVESVLGAFYDNSVYDAGDLGESNLERFLIAQSTYYKGNPADALAQLQSMNYDTLPLAGFGLLAELDPTNEEEYLDLALSRYSRHYTSLVREARLDYLAKRNLVTYVRTMTALAGNYPNSEAVRYLAEAYHDLGWFEEEQELWHRWHRIRPRSPNFALQIAFSRHRLQDQIGVIEALAIAQARDPLDERQYRYRSLYSDFIDNSYKVEEGQSGFVNTVRRGRISANSIQDDLTCDEQVELGLYTNDLDYAFDNLDCARRLWLQPPPWWIQDNPTWQTFVGDERYSSWRESMWITDQAIEALKPTSIRELFAPRRQVFVNFDSE